jgi:hypothetical protein
MISINGYQLYDGLIFDMVLLLNRPVKIAGKPTIYGFCMNTKELELNGEHRFCHHIADFLKYVYWLEDLSQRGATFTENGYVLDGKKHRRHSKRAQKEQRKFHNCVRFERFIFKSHLDIDPRYLANNFLIASKTLWREIYEMIDKKDNLKQSDYIMQGNDETIYIEELYKEEENNND